jgi:hypothetical protein
MQRLSAPEASLAHPASWPWPLPAVVVWAAAWALFHALSSLGMSGVLAMALGMGLGMWGRRWAETATRRTIVALGFPLSFMGIGLSPADQAWIWLALAVLLMLAYPRKAWRDAPFYPTATQALAGLAQAAPLAAGGRVLDAGCGLGHGLRALRRAYPQARFQGVEWSWPLAWAARLLCPWAQVRRGDMWAQDWSQVGLVYLFQRPESMARAMAKAGAEMRPGSYLVSLEFKVPEVTPSACCGHANGRPVWVYRIGGQALPTTEPHLPNPKEPPPCSYS